MINCGQPRKQAPIESQDVATHIQRIEADITLLGNRYQSAWGRISGFVEKLEQQQEILLINMQSVLMSMQTYKGPDVDELLSEHLQPLAASLNSIHQQLSQSPNAGFLDGGKGVPAPAGEGLANRPRSLHFPLVAPGGGSVNLPVAGSVKPHPGAHATSDAGACQLEHDDIQFALDVPSNGRNQCDVDAASCALDLQSRTVADVKSTIREEIQIMRYELRTWFDNETKVLLKSCSEPELVKVESSNNHNDFQWNLHLNDIKKAIHEEIKSAFSDVHVSDQSRGVPPSSYVSEADMEITNVDIDEAIMSPEESMKRMYSPNSVDDLEHLSQATFIKASVQQAEGLYETLDSFPVRADTSAFQAIQKGDANKVRRLLKKGLDPNSQLEMVVFGPKKYTHVSLLAAAVLMHNENVVKLLLDHKASLQSPYGFVAGSCCMHWYGSAMFACVPAEQLDLLQLLAERKANLHERSSNDGNLIWQCAYFGATRMMSYLLSHDVEFDIAAASQNDEGVSHSPLLCAVIQGRIACANQLIDVGADVNARNEVGVSPLQWAIRQSLPRVVQKLISHGARLEGKSANFFGACASRNAVTSAPSSKSCLELLFRVGNPVVVAAAACGLENQEEQVKALPKPAVFEFLSSSSDARCAMMRALFRERRVFYRGDHSEMVVRNTAYIEKSEALHGNRPFYHPNVAHIALSFDEINAMFNQRVHPTKEMMQFLDDLAPQIKQKHRPWSHERCVASIKTFECLVPGIYRELELLKIISDADDFDAVFTMMHTQAIVESCWQDVRYLAMLEVIIHFFVLILFLIIADSLPKEDHQTVRLCASIGVPIWIIVFLRELSDMIAHGAHGWHMDYVGHISNWVDIARIAADITIWASCYYEGADFARSFYIRVLFAACCFMKWIKLLYCLTPFQFFGLKTMPILHAMRDIGPFCIILLIYIAGIGHAFYALGLDHANVFDLSISAFLFSTVANFDLSGEMIEPNIEDETHKFIRQVFSMCGVFLVPVVLMNILIAALSNSYDTGVANMAQLYQARKSETSFGLLALQRILRGIGSKFREPYAKKQLWYSCEDPPEKNANES